MVTRFWEMAVRAAKVHGRFSAPVRCGGVFGCRIVSETAGNELIGGIAAAAVILAR